MAEAITEASERVTINMVGRSSRRGLTAAVAHRPRPRCWLCETSGRVLLHLRLRIDGWKGVCRRCVAKRRWVTVREALQGGFPLATLRLVESTTKLDAKTRLLTPMFSLDELESLASGASSSRPPDRVRAKLDLRALMSVARRARAGFSAS
jgi:hypothetical protein